MAPDAWIIGDVTLGEKVTVLFSAVLRGDILPIRIGKESNVQDHVMIHTSRGRISTTVGEKVTIGHRAVLHGCTIRNRVLVGMGSIILDEAEIADDCVIGAGTLITEGKKIPPRSLVIGSPGRVVRELTDQEVAFLLDSAASYVKVGEKYRGIFRT